VESIFTPRLSSLVLINQNWGFDIPFQQNCNMVAASHVDNARARPPNFPNKFLERNPSRTVLYSVEVEQNQSRRIEDEGHSQVAAVTADFAMAEAAMVREQSGEDMVETAVRAHSRMVYRIAFSVVRNATDAEDAVQETFLRVLRYKKKMTGVRDPKAWLAQIAWRVAVERRGKASLTALQHEEAGDNLPASGDGADRTLLIKERTEFLQQMIAALPEDLRDPLVLSTLEELSPREVGEVLGISEAAVRSRSFRARQILRERMTAHRAGWMGAKK
jgi:RNA polymerase sigma-70 factor (ECF subfamily)